ncbi:hypothetical protein ACLOAV_003684 [Pseudogymnoascus australis]
MTTSSQEEISVFLTTLWVYEHLLQPAEHLLVFQTDSMLCANARQSINEWLHFDWVGAPWHPDGKWGGNGGLSLRRVAPIIEILRHQVRGHEGGPEDVWLSERLADRPGAVMANGSLSLTFSGEMHTGGPTHVRPSGLKIPEEDREKRPAGGGSIAMRRMRRARMWIGGARGSMSRWGTIRGIMGGRCIRRSGGRWR